MFQCLRHLIPVACVAVALHAVPASAQNAMTLSTYCTFDGREVTEDIYVFGSFDAVRDAVDRVLEVVGLPLTLNLRAANVEGISAGRAADERYILYNIYLAEGLA